jgi:L-ectoine synthase
MIVRGLDALKSLGQFAEKPGAWTSSRYLLAKDQCGFTLTQTTLAAGARSEMEYKNHIEANLIIEGQARVTDVASGEVHELGPGDMYALDQNDRHVLEAVTDLRIVCVFTPALVGPETHDADGSYPLLDIN